MPDLVRFNRMSVESSRSICYSVEAGRRELRALLARHSLSNEAERWRANAMSNLAVNGAGSAVGRYAVCMCRPSHSLAPRIASGSGGATRSRERVRLPAMDSTGSEEPCLILTLRQDCFDTPIRARSTGPGKESGTKTRRTRSVGVKQDQNTAADANALRGETDVCFQYPSLTNLDRGTRIGFRTTGDLTGASSCTIRRSNTGTAWTSPLPSTTVMMDAKIKPCGTGRPVVMPKRRKLGVAG